MTPAQLLVKGEITHFQQSTSGGKQGISIKGFTIGAESDTAQINAVIYIVDSTTGQGHTLKHLLAAGAIFALVVMLRRREAIDA